MRNSMHIWPSSKTYHGQIYVRSASFRAKMMTSTYILQYNISKFDTSQDSTWLLCKLEMEDLTHFLGRCPALKRTCRKAMGRLLKKLKQRKATIPKSDEEKTMLILNGIQQDEVIQNACSYVCFQLHLKSDKIIKGMYYWGILALVSFSNISKIC